MSNHNPSNLKSSDNLASLQEEVAELRLFKTAFNAQKELMNTFVSMGQRASGNLLLRAMLRQTLEIFARISQAEESSLFWLDEDGLVTESILARGVVIREQKQNVIGQVLEHGLAGWVFRKRQVGLIQDTETDDRWYNLPNQPYTVRSVLCVPIVRGKMLLAILTLMHSQTNHFTPQSARLMEVTAEQMALVLDQVRFYLEHLPIQAQTPHLQSSISAPTPTPQSSLPLSNVGIFMITDEGRFMYADPRLAQLFGYTLGELVELEYFFALIAEDHRHPVIERMYQCFQDQLQNLLLTFKGLCKDQRWVKVDLYARKTKLYGKYVMIGVVNVHSD